MQKKHTCQKKRGVIRRKGEGEKRWMKAKIYRRWKNALCPDSPQEWPQTKSAIEQSFGSFGRVLALRGCTHTRENKFHWRAFHESVERRFVCDIKAERRSVVFTVIRWFERIVRRFKYVSLDRFIVVSASWTWQRSCANTKCAIAVFLLVTCITAFDIRGYLYRDNKASEQNLQLLMIQAVYCTYNIFVFNDSEYFDIVKQHSDINDKVVVSKLLANNIVILKITMA